VALDMRGYGDSDKPTTLEDYKMAHLVNDIKEIIEALGVYISQGVKVRAKTSVVIFFNPVFICNLYFGFSKWCGKEIQDTSCRGVHSSNPL
jgi:uncharacterized membrane protein